ncbi:MAG: prolipoprotein diacylglyceryl transferase [Deltaproteobacteria bacterium]|nr:prolipoprotein diacylglyceryl transferase [Deltaproteobacteria bacterium]
MYPILFKLGSFELFTYGLMMALGVLAGLVAVNFEAKRYGWDRDQMTRLVVWVFLMGLLGSRVVYVFTRMNEPNIDLVSIAFNLRAGFVYYGGLLASWLFLIWYVRRYKMPFWPVMDTFAYGICIGLAIGRIGCLLGGCCYGTPTDLPWGVIMANERQLGHLHPTQLYEFLVLVIMFVPLWLRRTRKRYEGEITVWFVGVYAIARYVLEIYRGDLIRGYVIDEVMTTSQFISVPMLVVAVWLHFKLRGRRIKSGARAA